MLGFDAPDQRAGEHRGVIAGGIAGELSQRRHGLLLPRRVQPLVQQPRGGVVRRGATGTVDTPETDNDR